MPIGTKRDGMLKNVHGKRTTKESHTKYRLFLTEEWIGTNRNEYDNRNSA